MANKDKLGTSARRDDDLDERDGPEAMAELAAKIPVNREDAVKAAAMKGDGYQREPMASVQSAEGDRDDRAVSDDERLKMFLETFINSSLPEMPEIPGWHLCWLSTTNTKDSIASRLRVGYQIVKPEELPGYSNYRLSSGQYEGCIGINEMILAKLPSSLYQRFMAAVHHELPYQEAAKLKYQAESIAQEAQSEGADVLISKGLREIDRRAKTPDFNDPDWGRLQPYGAS